MSTVEDFKNAPVGATATCADGGRAMKVDDEGRPWVYTHGFCMDDEDLTQRGFTLDPLEPWPTSAREALDLAWELAHPVKEGQVIPEGTQYLEFDRSGLREYTAYVDYEISPHLAPNVRTVEPLPDPEPDWLDAPAVLAETDWCAQEVWLPQTDGHWKCTCCHSESHWSDLHDVTPLYPKETEA